MINDCRSKTLVWHFRGPKNYCTGAAHRSLSSAGLFAHTPLLIASVFPSGCGPCVCVCACVSGKEYDIILYVIHSREVGRYTYALARRSSLGEYLKQTRVHSHTNTIYTLAHTHFVCKRTSIILRWTTPPPPTKAYK